MTEQTENAANPPGPLHGLTAVVTGAGSGIGRATALQLAHDGADVLVHSGHRTEAAGAVAEQIRTCGRRSHVAVHDLSTQVGITTLLDDAYAWSTDIDIWVNNAGADVLTGSLAERTFADKLAMLWQVDVSATIQLSRGVGDRMRQRGGAIVNMGWDQANWGMAGDSGEMFAATKGAVMAFSQSLARSLAPRVRVNCVAPGWIKTAWGEQAPDAWKERAMGESLLHRWGKPEDVARTIAFLVSPQAAFINKQTVAINGGMQPWPVDWANDWNSEKS